MFAKTDRFTPDEIALARTLNSRRQRVILWSQDELEPYHVYERSEHRLPEKLKYSRTLTDLARITNVLWFDGDGT